MSECSSALARCMENIPILGHFIAMCHACAKKTPHAERAGIKATLGICMCICNFPTECVDECVRHKATKLRSYTLTLRPEWMKKYHRHTLKQICLPGSHQSTSYCVKKKLRPVPMATGWSKCQDLSLSAQLRGGIRFLDLRIMTDGKGEIWTHHNVVTCISFKEVLDTVRGFVTDHPSEIIGLAITNDGKNVDWTLCRSLLNEYLGERLILPHMKEMLIGDIVDQGKNIFIFGMPNVAFSWKEIHEYWPNKEWPEDLRMNLEGVLSDEKIMDSEDLLWYKAECTPQFRMIGRAVGGVPGAYFAQKADEKFEFVEDMAAAVNQIVFDILNGINENPFNILSTDYVQDEVVDRIIELNRHSQHEETFIISGGNQTLLSGASNENILDGVVNMSNPSYRYKPLDQIDTFNSQNKTGNVSFSPDTTPTRDSQLSTRLIPGQKPTQRSSTYSTRKSTLSTHNVSIRSSRSSGMQNTTIGSMSGQFEMGAPKAPPLEVKETTM